MKWFASIKDKVVEGLAIVKSSVKELKKVAKTNVRGAVVFILSKILKRVGDMGENFVKNCSKGERFVKNLEVSDINQSPETYHASKLQLGAKQHEPSQVPDSPHDNSLNVVPHLNSDLHLLRDPYAHVPDNGGVHDPPLVPNLTPHTDGGDAFRL